MATIHDARYFVEGPYWIQCEQDNKRCGYMCYGYTALVAQQAYLTHYKAVHHSDNFKFIGPLRKKNYNRLAYL